MNKKNVAEELQLNMQQRNANIKSRCEQKIKDQKEKYHFRNVTITF